MEQNVFEACESIVRILLLDDHALFRESVARLLNAEPDFDVVATCGSIEEGLSILQAASVDIVLLDLDLGQSGGAQFIRLAREQGYGGKFLVVTAGVDKLQAGHLIRSGISGIFTKSNSASLLKDGIRDVMTGKVSFDQELLQGALAGIGEAAVAQTRRFTEREKLVLSGVFEGLANKEIATQLGVSEGTIKAAIQQLFSKTGVRTRSQLVRVALERLQDDPPST
jgi:DNA-binding NarL/FixJ family response regulator